MNERRLRWGIGLFVLLALVLLGTMIVMFGSLPTVFKRANLYTIRFVDAPGVGSGTPVRRSGVRIGEVREVILDDERGIVRVQIAVDPRYSLRRNEQPTLNVSILGGDVSIDFLPQPVEEGQLVDRSVLQPGSEIVGVQPANVNTLLNRASEVAPTAQETLNEIRRSLQRLERLTPTAEQTMREYRDLASDVRKSIPDLRTTNTEFQNLVKETRKALPSVQQASDDLAATARTWGRVGERLNVWIQGNQENLTKAIENVNTVLTRAGNLLNDENQRNVSAILKNSRAASNRFDSISRNLDSLLEDSRATPKHLEKTLNKMDLVLDTWQQASKPLADRSLTISRNLDESLYKSNLALSDVVALFRVLDQNDSVMRRLLTDPSLYNNLNDAACMLVKMMPRLDRIFKDLETFADKLARHPEAIGIGGVVRPGSGLKDSPAPLPRSLQPGP